MLSGFLSAELKDWVELKSSVIKKWIATGKMRDVDPKHLFFMIWAATQTYADFTSQITAVLGRDKLSDQDYRTAARQLSGIILRGCGIAIG
jgi:TetR/AcrR family transcriptional regulator